MLMLLMLWRGFGGLCQNADMLTLRREGVGAGVNILHYSQRKIWEKFPIFQRLGKSFLIFEFARHLSQIDKYAFFLVTTISISGKRKILILFVFSI